MDITGQREIQVFDESLFDRLIDDAEKRPRRRLNYNFHGGPADNPQRFLNVFLEGSYLAPHRHLSPPKAEAFLVLRGWMAAFTFDDDGAVERTVLIGAGEAPGNLSARFSRAPQVRGVDIPPGVWHTVAAVSAAAVCYEVKPGPWDAASDKEFAPWAPREDQPGAAEYLDRLVNGA